MSNHLAATKKCPICNGDTAIQQTRKKKYYVACRKCLTGIGRVFNTAEEAIKYWNTNVPKDDSYPRTV